MFVILLFYLFSKIINFFATYNVYQLNKINKNKNSPLYDIGHVLFKENYSFSWFSEIVYIYIILLVVYLIKTKNDYLLKKSIIIISVLFLIRAISINLTILPLPKESCTNKPPFIYGGCGDLMFSGHFCYYTVLLYICLFKLEIALYLKIFILLNFCFSLINTLHLRNHYSIDIYISIIISFLTCREIIK